MITPVLESFCQNLVQGMRICPNNNYGKHLLYDIIFKKNFRISSFICNLYD